MIHNSCKIFWLCSCVKQRNVMDELSGWAERVNVLLSCASCWQPDGEIILDSDDRPLLRETDEILNTYASLCKVEQRVCQSKSEGAWWLETVKRLEVLHGQLALCTCQLHCRAAPTPTATSASPTFPPSPHLQQSPGCSRRLSDPVCRRAYT